MNFCFLNRSLTSAANAAWSPTSNAIEMILKQEVFSMGKQWMFLSLSACYLLVLGFKI